MKESLYAMVVIMLMAMCIAVSCYVNQVKLAMPLTKIMVTYDNNVTKSINRK